MTATLVLEVRNPLLADEFLMNVRERDDDILTTVLCKLTNLFYEFRQGCQLPGFSLKPQIFYYTTADFSATFLYICSRPILFCTSHHKTTSKHPNKRIQEFWLFFCEKILWPQTKTLTDSSCALAGLWLAVSNAYFQHFAQFSDFFWNTHHHNVIKFNVGNPEFRPSRLASHHLYQ